ncbi:MAG: biotin transporter BioY [Lachnospiraceae bacterium]|nr:biotin transporter BioY [Lachnospiraceae bacterium]
MKTVSMIFCGLCAAITCVLAPIAIPMPGGVPISLATFSVMLAGCLLGPKWGTLSQTIYVLLGAVGLPVFSGMRGGMGVIAGMTGGYIVAYILLAFISGFVYFRFGKKEQGRTQRALILVIGMILGTLALYAFGTAWFMKVTGMDLKASLAACVLPFLPGDAIKIAAVTILIPVLERALPASLSEALQ